MLGFEAKSKTNKQTTSKPKTMNDIRKCYNLIHSLMGRLMLTWQVWRQ